MTSCISILELLNIKKILPDNLIHRVSQGSHGNINSLSFVIQKLLISMKFMINKIFKNLDYLIIDCLRYKKYPSHFGLDDILRINKLLNSKK